MDVTQVGITQVATDTELSQHCSLAQMPQIKCYLRVFSCLGFFTFHALKE